MKSLVVLLIPVMINVIYLPCVIKWLVRLHVRGARTIERINRRLQHGWTILHLVRIVVVIRYPNRTFLYTLIRSLHNLLCLPLIRHIEILISVLLLIKLSLLRHHRYALSLCKSVAWVLTMVEWLVLLGVVYNLDLGLRLLVNSHWRHNSRWRSTGRHMLGRKLCIFKSARIWMRIECHLIVFGRH